MDLAAIAGIIAAALGIPLIRFAQSAIEELGEAAWQKWRQRVRGEQPAEGQDERSDHTGALVRSLDSLFVDDLGHRVNELAENLRRDSSELNGLLVEMQAITERRLSDVSEQEKKLQELTDREVSLKERIASLEATRPEAVEEFVRLLQRQQAEAEARAQVQQKTLEIRSARRDYILFLAGVLASVVVAIVLSSLGVGP
jgi:DNA repair exonuclease SbcCD ATPase subunit